MIKEAVVETFQEIIHAVNNGANRIELCDNLKEGGTTPSIGMVKCAVDYCHPASVEVAVMIRPRGGNFHYSIFEHEIMRQDILSMQMLAVDYFVIGMLTEDETLDTYGLSQLMQLTTIPFVMHMAFDQIDKNLQLKALDQLIQLGFVRLLTHGNADSHTSILDNMHHLAKLLMHSKGKINIMPGGGLNKDNIDKLLSNIPFSDVHGTKII